MAAAKPTAEEAAKAAEEKLAKDEAASHRSTPEGATPKETSSTSGGRWRIAHAMVGSFNENDIVSDNELGEGIDRLISLGAVEPLNDDAKAKAKAVLKAAESD